MTREFDQEAEDRMEEAIYQLEEELGRDGNVLTSISAAAAARAADPLRKKLGPAAVQAILEGNAAVVRIRDGEHSIDFISYNGPSRCDMLLRECRLDQPEEPKP